MLLAALSINRRQLEPQHHPLQPHYYSAALRPLRRYLADHPDDMLAPLLSQLERSPPASVEDARQVYAAALERLTWPGSCAPARPPLWQALTGRGSAPGSLPAFLDAAFALLASESRGRLIDCPEDPSLPHGGAGAAAAAGRVAIVSNLRNAEGAAPNMVLQTRRAGGWACCSCCSRRRACPSG
ncbi:hypothetical protein MNEG_12417 [Monoraphidium neglectum]|uniref:Uncharacterized protein n=1 Tax=Monoraphidium neglectum TaxID=145388 RepID=A0A0D2J6X0_9CHLO|nr:hypothetical protein MNEG_12417 [Monoraphidium neglectum]KIY95547.1 hypothetical protein MNEG_12417 [Monoraphidium neglectum]|eukprot:XP_013894567.1 hypothetical protein MNEG_12417 [Monoraphidium neglectum]